LKTTENLHLLMCLSGQLFADDISLLPTCFVPAVFCVSQIPLVTTVERSIGLHFLNDCTVIIFMLNVTVNIYP